MRILITNLYSGFIFIVTAIKYAITLCSEKVPYLPVYGLVLWMVNMQGQAVAAQSPDKSSTQKATANFELFRHRPGEQENDNVEDKLQQENTEKISAPEAEEIKPENPNGKTSLTSVATPDYRQPPEFTTVSDRWRLPGDLGLVNERWYDPYNFNMVKGDRPIFGNDWFFNFSAISDSVAEPRRLPPALASGTQVAGDQFLFVQNLILAMSFYKGETVYRPPDFEFRFNPVINTNLTTADSAGSLYADAGQGKTRWDHDISLQQVSLDMHLRTVSDRYDFDRIRIGIQPFTADYRGFLYLDNPLGARLYGTRDNNLWQYNFAFFNRIEKDTNSGLNELIMEGLRDDKVFVASLYRQDFPVLGFTSQGTVLYNRNREGSQKYEYYDHNDFQSRPSNLGGGYHRNYDVAYLGYNGDGHIGRVNLTTSVYGAFGKETAGPFTGKSSTIISWFAALELSMDFDWIRPRLSILHGSGDDNPYDNTSNAFDAILENPAFAGGETSFWIRQAVPYSKGIKLTGRNGILNAMRSSKEQGQSNFTNPGVQLVGLGVDFDLLPELRLSVNVNKLLFDETAVLEATSNKKVHSDIGWDNSIALTYRPLQNQNIILRMSGGVLVPGQGFKDIYGDHVAYSVLANLILAY